MLEKGPDASFQSQKALADRDNHSHHLLRFKEGYKMCLIMPAKISWVLAVPRLEHAGSGGGQKDPHTTGFHTFSVSADLHSRFCPSQRTFF